MKYKFKLFMASKEEDIAEFEKLMASSYSDGGEITIVQKETKLTEMGEYLIALHWLETGSANEDKKTIRDMLEDRM